VPPAAGSSGRRWGAAAHGGEVGSGEGEGPDGEGEEGRRHARGLRGGLRTAVWRSCRGLGLEDFLIYESLSNVDRQIARSTARSGRVALGQFVTGLCRAPHNKMHGKHLFCRAPHNKTHDKYFCIIKIF
jgi:hypothetical protein